MSERICAVCGATDAGHLGYFDNEDGTQEEVDLCDDCARG